MTTQPDTDQHVAVRIDVDGNDHPDRRRDLGHGDRRRRRRP